MKSCARKRGERWNEHVLILGVGVAACLLFSAGDLALQLPSDHCKHKMDPRQPQQQPGYPAGGTGSSAPGGTAASGSTNPGGQQQPQSGAAPQQQQQQAMATTQQQIAQLEQAQRRLQAQINAAGAGAGVGNTGANTATGTAGATAGTVAFRTTPRRVDLNYERCTWQFCIGY